MGEKSDACSSFPFFPLRTAGGGTGIIPVVIGGAGQPPQVRVILPGIRCMATNPLLDGRDSESKIELFYY